MTGLVDADRFHDVGILFPAIWTDPGFSGTLPRGTPIAQCFAVPRQPLELEFAAFSRADAERYDATASALLAGPHHYRRTFRAARSPGAPEPEGADIPLAESTDIPLAQGSTQPRGIEP